MDLDKESVPEARVWANYYSEKTQVGHKTDIIKTDSKGKFELNFSLFPEGTQVVVFAMHPDYGNTPWPHTDGGANDYGKADVIRLNEEKRNAENILVLLASSKKEKTSIPPKQEKQKKGLMDNFKGIFKSELSDLEIEESKVLAKKMDSDMELRGILKFIFPEQGDKKGEEILKNKYMVEAILKESEYLGLSDNETKLIKKIKSSLK
jgi:hypothetical protein